MQHINKDSRKQIDPETFILWVVIIAMLILGVFIDYDR